MARDKKPIMIEEAALIFKNFKGKAGQYNDEGQRNFGVRLDNDGLIRKLQRDGYNIKHLRAAEEGGEQQAWLPVSVNFNNRPPQVFMQPEDDARRRIQLDEESVEVLDYVDIVNVDLMISPYDWEIGGKRGTKAYLQSMYVTIEEDPLARKHRLDLEDIPARSGRIDD